MSTPTRIVVEKNGHLFVGLNLPSTLTNRSTWVAGLDFPPRPSTFTITKLEPKAARELQWALDDFIYLPYIMKSPQFDGVLFARLNYMPVTAIGSEFVLAQGTSESWQLLEANLLKIFDVLFRTPISLPDLSFLYQRPIPPSEFGYTRFHTSWADALDAAMASRHAFVVLMGAISWAISLHEPWNDHDYPSWVNTLTKAGVEAEYVDALMSHPISNFSGEIHRVGTIVHPNWQCVGEVGRLVLARIPFFICFGSKPGAYKTVFHGHEVEKYEPNTDEVSDACRARAAGPSETAGVQNTDVDMRNSRAVAPDPSAYPTPSISTVHSSVVTSPLPQRPIDKNVPRSRQQPGETWKAFLDRQRARNRERCHQRHLPPVSVLGVCQRYHIHY